MNFSFLREAVAAVAGHRPHVEYIYKFYIFRIMRFPPDTGLSVVLFVGSLYLFHRLLVSTVLYSK